MAQAISLRKQATIAGNGELSMKTRQLLMMVYALLVAFLLSACLDEGVAPTDIRDGRKYDIPGAVPDTNYIPDIELPIL